MHHAKGVDDVKSIAGLMAKLASEKDLQKIASVTRGYKVSEKLQRQAEEPHRFAIACALALLKHAETDGSIAALVKALREQDKDIKSSDPYLACLRAFISYGKHGTQYASRDKRVLQLAQKVGVAPTGVPEFIQTRGGLVACAAEARNRLGKGNQANALLDAANAAAAREGDVALLVVRRGPGSELTVSRRFKIRVGRSVSERKKFYTVLKLKLSKLGASKV